MNYFRFEVALSLVLGLCLCSNIQAQPEPNPHKAEPNVEQIRKMLDFDLSANTLLERFPPLVAMGEDLFPAFKIILADPTSSTRVLDNLFRVLASPGMEKTDQRCLLELVMARLTDPEASLRIKAIGFLGQFGSERDTPPVVALLSDQNAWVGIQAADTLSKIGGRRDLLAMDAWLRSGAAHREHRTLPGYVKKCRDKLEQRLKEAEKKEKEKEKK